MNCFNCKKNIFSTKPTCNDCWERNQNIIQKLYDGFFCRKCITRNYVVMKLNDIDKLSYQCNKCKNKWI